MLKNYLKKGRVEAGCDEAGRGCLAGPVFAAAVIWPSSLILRELNDSKKISALKRESFRSFIEENIEHFAVSQVDQKEIDRINILQASFTAMHLAIDQLIKKPDHLLIDGNRFREYKGISHSCIIRGDGKYSSIAAASILAKTYRDAYMLKLHEQFPHYAWNSNKGYATKKHREAIMKHGLSPHHRLSFCKRFITDL